MKAVSVIAHLAVVGLLIGLGASIRWLTSLDPMAKYTQEYAGAGMGEAVVRLEQITAESRKGMVREWRMTADAADVDRSGYYWNLHQVRRASLFDKGRESVFLSTENARWDGIAQELVLGSLQVTRNTHKVFAQRGHWRQRLQRLDLAGPIRLVSADAEGVASSVVMNAASNTLVVTDGRLLLAQAAIPEVTSTVTTRPAGSADTRRRIEITFKRFTERQGKTREGEGVTVKDGDAVFTADRAEQDIPGRRVTATGNLRMTEPRAEGTGDKLDIDLKDKLAVLTGNVRFTLRPRNTDGPPPDTEDTRTLSTELRKPVLIECDRAENRYRDKQVTLTGSLKLTQTIADGKQRTLTAEKAVYDGRTETVVLSGNVYGRDEKGQEFRMPRVTIGVKEGDEWVRAEDGGTIVVFDEEEEGNGSSTPAQPSAPAGSEPTKPNGASTDTAAPDKRGD